MKDFITIATENPLIIQIVEKLPYLTEDQLLKLLNQINETDNHQ